MRLIDADRLVLPRWRSLSATVARGEAVGGIVSGSVSLELSRCLALLERRYSDLHGIESAADLVAFVVGHGLEVSGVARSAAELVEKEVSDKLAVHRMALRLLQRGILLPHAADGPWARVAALKHRVRVNPRDALSWIELGRWHATLGQKEKARAAVLSAVALVDSDRYIVRSAARFFCHIEEPDLALWTLRRARLVMVDPWLSASLVAVATKLDESEKAMRTWRRAFAIDVAPSFEKSELAAALGTVELKLGNERRAKKWLRAALVEPAENAIAQASWVSRRVMNLDIPPDLAIKEDCYEAVAWARAESGDVVSAIANCRSWLDEEPFSARPAIVGSFVGVVSGLSFEDAAQIARQGLVANPDDALLGNNLAASLAELGRLEEADKAVQRAIRCSPAGRIAITLEATRGLMEFRAGRVESGEALYRRAMAEAKEIGDDQLYEMAELHLAMELARAGKGRTVLEGVLQGLDAGADLGLRLASERGRRVLEGTLGGEGGIASECGK
jgi:tetratricopeptide (TPR) repeat protein